MKPMNKGPVRRIRLRAVVAYPAVTVALVVSIALVLTPFGPAQGMALTALATPTETATATTTTAPPTVPTVAPTSVPTTAAATTSAPTPSTSAGPVPNPTPGVDPSLAPALAVPIGHHVLARIGDADLVATYLAVDAPVLDASRFQTFRARFQMHNVGTLPITATTRLEYRADGAAGFAVVPENPELGIPFYVAREWVSSLGLGGGTVQGPLGEDIAVADFKMSSQAGKTAVVGHHSMGANPDIAMTLPADSYTEQEFTVRLTMDAQYLTGYELRITDGGTAMQEGQVARVVLGSPPPLPSSAGQRQGVAVPAPTAPNAAGAVYALLAAPTTAPATTSVTALPAVEPAGAPLYALDAASVTGVTVPVIDPAADASTDSHDIGAGQCSACHRGHTAKAPDLTKESQQSTLCFSCHDGLGAGKDVKSQYALTRPVNVPANREYYSHDAVDTSTATTHTLELNEFEGVSNRHSECADCHNSHKAGSTDSTQALDGTGWTASGRLAGVSGVKVLNGAAGSAPTYTLLSGLDTDVVPANEVTREYQVCFKCHSGFTNLLPPIAGKPSKDALDKAVEFNPANPSFHPVEAAGKNQTPKMAASLAGESPYKLWNFEVGGTVRCLNCHASSATPDVTPPLPLPGAVVANVVAPHTSSNRGILLRNYRDRVLNTSVDAYNNADFALCYTCHSNTPFAAGEGGTDRTNFSLHGKHTASLEGGSGGTDIDTAGAGQGNAICAECHFRLHSTKYKVGTQTIDGSRLVNFAPNVEPDVPGGVISWTPKGASTPGSCALTCHGKSHTAGEYKY